MPSFIIILYSGTRCVHGHWCRIAIRPMRCLHNQYWNAYRVDIGHFSYNNTNALSVGPTWQKFYPDNPPVICYILHILNASYWNVPIIGDKVWFNYEQPLVSSAFLYKYRHHDNPNSWPICQHLWLKTIYREGHTSWIFDGKLSIMCVFGQQG